MGRVKAIRVIPAGAEGRVAAGEPVFSRVGIVGLGSMGVALGSAIRAAWPSALVVGVDDNAAIERAIRSHTIDVGGDDHLMLSDVELIILTGSPEQCAEALGALGEHVTGPAVVTTMCGAAAVAELARALPPRLTFVAGELVEPAAAQGAACQAGPGWLGGREWRLESQSDDPGAAAAVERLRHFVDTLSGRRVPDAC
jgi:ketopantoate reductase